MLEPRHEFYETDERVIISIYDKGVMPQEVSIHFSARGLTYEHRDKKLALHPLAGDIDPDGSDFTVGKFKVEVRLIKKPQGRWTKLIGDDKPLAADPSEYAATTPGLANPKPKKHWEGIVEEAITAEPDKALTEDPNAGGDTALNGFFQKLFSDADEDTKKAMMKSYQESGGTALSTNWADVGKRKVEVQPPEGSEWKKWG